MNSTQLDFERAADGRRFDETDVSLRAYVARLPEDHLAQYDPAWSDEQVMAWDGNFKNEGDLMLVCCERDVDAGEFRQVVEEFLAFRQKMGERRSVSST